MVYRFYIANKYSNPVPLYRTRSLPCCVMLNRLVMREMVAIQAMLIFASRLALFAMVVPARLGGKTYVASYLE
jgi:hypothetical protein